MNANALRELLRQKPFTPFELSLSSGDRFPVMHPEMMLLMKEPVILALPAPGREELPDRYETISYLHIAAASPLETSSAGDMRA